MITALSYFAQAIATEAALKDPTDSGDLIWVKDPLTARAGVVSAAPALGHLGGSIPKASLQASSDGVASFNVLHRNLSFPKKKATVMKITVA